MKKKVKYHDNFSEQTKKVMDKLKQMPVPKEYHAVLNKYVKIIFKWAPILNHQLTFCNDKAYNRKFTGATCRLLKQHNFHIHQACCIRDAAVSVFSSITLVGMHYPTDRAVGKYDKLIDLVDEAILNHLALAERYRNAIRYKHKPKTVPVIKALTVEELSNNENWPYHDINVAFHEHGMMVLGIYEGQPK